MIGIIVSAIIIATHVGNVVSVHNNYDIIGGELFSQNYGIFGRS